MDTLAIVVVVAASVSTTLFGFLSWTVYQYWKLWSGTAIYEETE